MSNWKDRAGSFIVPDFITHKVGGEDHHFYPISIGLVFKIKTLAEPLAEALSVIFSDTDTDSGSKSRRIKDGTADITEMEGHPISVELAKLRVEQRSGAYRKLIESVADNRDLFAEIIMDSMRDVWPRTEKIPAVEFHNNVPAPAVAQMVMGVIKANKGILGPLAPTLERLMDEAKVRLEQRTQKTPGESSNQPSSRSSNEVTIESGSSD